MQNLHVVLACGSASFWWWSSRAVGVPTKLLVYPEDVHAIDKPASEADHWIHIGQWLAQHL